MGQGEALACSSTSYPQKQNPEKYSAWPMKGITYFPVYGMGGLGSLSEEEEH